MKRMLAVVLLVLFFALALASTALADGVLYVVDTNDNTIHRINTDRSGQAQVIAAQPRAIGDIAVDEINDHIYWNLPSWGAIMRADLADGANPTAVITGTAGMGYGIDVDPTTEHIYWCNASTKYLKKTTYDGTSTIDLVYSFDRPLDLKVDPENEFVYWISEGDPSYPYVANTDGTGRDGTRSRSGTFGETIALDVQGGWVFYNAEVVDDGYDDTLYGVGTDRQGLYKGRESINCNAIAVDPSANIIYTTTPYGYVVGYNVGGLYHDATPRLFSGLGALGAIEFLALPEITVSDVSVLEGDEGNTAVTLTATLSRAYNTDVATAQFSTTVGTATLDTDFEATTGQFSFAAGVTTTVATVNIYGDALDEADEVFFVDLSDGVNCAIVDGTGEVTILDDDDPPTISVADAQVTESTGVTTTLRFTVTLSAVSGLPITVTASTADGSATAPQDYTALVSQQITFSPGETSKFVDVTVVGDTIYELTETLLMNLTSPSNVTLDDGQAIGTIVSDDALPSVSISDGSLTEGDAGSANMIFTASLNHASYSPITITLSTSDGTATAGSDYGALLNQVLVIPAGLLQATQNVAIIGDLGYEGDETFSLYITGAAGVTLSDGSGTGTILENDAAPTLSMGDVVIGEGDADSMPITFTASINPFGVNPVTGQASTVDGTATAADGDYLTITAQPFTIPAGQTSTEISVMVQGDTKHEYNETFDLVLSGVLGALPTTVTSTCTITDNDVAPSVSLSDGVKQEGNVLGGAMTFTATLSAVSGRAVTVTYNTADDTATAGSDYTAVGATELVFSPGQITRTFEVIVLADTTDEYDEQFQVNLSTPVNCTIDDGQGIGTILDNDDPPMVSLSDSSVVEGDSGPAGMPFTATLAVASGKPVTLTLSTLDGQALAGSDYAAVVSQTLAISPGALTATYSVDVTGDTTDEHDETYLLRIDQAQNATISVGEASGTILDDDDAPSIAIGNTSVAEGDSGSVSAIFAVTLSAASGKTVSATATVVSGTATVDDNDFVDDGSMPVLFPVGSVTQNITVTVNGDTTYEPNETFGVVLGTLSNATAGDLLGSGTIGNDDAVPSVSIADASVVEGDTGTVSMAFTATLSSASYQTTGASVGLAADSATAGIDYVDLPGSLSFAPGATEDTFEVTVNGDTAAEGNETLTVTLAAPSNCSIDDGSATGTIIDDDPEVVLLGNGIEIADGDTLAGTADGTDFGQVPVAGGRITHTFVISNASGIDLWLNGIPKVAVSGAHASDFVVTAQPTSPVTAWMSTTFAVTFDPSVAGARTATVSFVSTDDDETPYDLSVAGTGVETDLAVAMSLIGSTSPMIVGDRLTYTIAVDNHGNQAATGVTVLDTLPAALTFAGPVSMQGATGILAQSGADLPDLAHGFSIAPGGKVTITLPVTVTGASYNITNTVAVACSENPVSATDDIASGRSEHGTSYVDGALGTDALGFGAGPGALAYRSVQEAVDHTESTVRIAAGTYHEHVVLEGQSLLGAASASGPDGQVIIDGGGSGTVVKLTWPVGYFTGLTIQNGDIGILVTKTLRAAPTSAPNLKDLGGLIEVHFCNILNHNQYGIQNSLFTLQNGGVQAVFDATDNWWGANDGPSGVGSGSGSAVSANVTYDPWLGAGVASSSTGTMPPGKTTLDACDETGIVVSKSGTGAPVLTVARYDGNPQGFVADGIGLYYDVQLSSAEGVDELVVRFYLTADQTRGYFPVTIEMLFWDGADWVLCSSQTLVQGDLVVNGKSYVAYLELLIDSTTTPSLSDLTGTAFALRGVQQVPPADMEMSLTAGPDPFCPGWSLSYVMMLTNTSTITLSNLVVDDVLPEEACCLADDAGTDAAVAYDAGSNSAVWQADDLAPGETLTLRYTVHTFTSVAGGSTLTNTMTISSTELTQAGSVAAGALVDAGICGMQPTPTPSPTPPVYSALLPLILQ